MVLTPTSLAWMNGEYINFDDARVHVRTDCVTRGGSVFEGVPAYWNDEQGQLAVFRLDDHMHRLEQSMRVMRMTLEYPVGVIREALLELLRRCEVRQDVHVRPTIYFGLGPNFAFRSKDIGVGAFITATPFPRVLNASVEGIRVAVSSWTRISDGDQPPRVKTAANYLNSRLAQVQAVVDGYDGAVLLNSHGYVAEGPAACLMMIRDGVISTPRITDGILESITRATLMQIIQSELGLEVRERAIDRTELYIADELFECGSAHEVTPIVGVDNYAVGKGERGPITEKVVELYSAIVYGKQQKYASWLTKVY